MQNQLNSDSDDKDAPSTSSNNDKLVAACDDENYLCRNLTESVSYKIFGDRESDDGWLKFWNHIYNDPVPELIQFAHCRANDTDTELSPVCKIDISMPDEYLHCVVCKYLRNRLKRDLLQIIRWDQISLTNKVVQDNIDYVRRKCPDFDNLLLVKNWFNCDRAILASNLSLLMKLIFIKDKKCFAIQNHGIGSQGNEHFAYSHLFDQDFYKFFDDEKRLLECKHGNIDGYCSCGSQYNSEEDMYWIEEDSDPDKNCKFKHSNDFGIYEEKK